MKNKKVVKKSFESCHRVCKDLFILSVPFECMEQWNTPIHNHVFSKEDIIEYTKGLFELKDWMIKGDTKIKRSIAVLRKI